MGDRQVYSYFNADSVSRYGSTSIGVASLSFTGDANSVYLILASCEQASNNTGSASKCSLVRDDPEGGSYLEWVGFNWHRPRSTSDWVAVNFADIYETGSSAESLKYSIFLGAEGSTGTAYVRNCSIIAIKLSSDDKYTRQSGTDWLSTTSTSPETAISLTLNPATEKDYLILAITSVINSSSSYAVCSRLLVGSTGYHEADIRQATTNWNSFPAGGSLKQTISAETTVAWQYWTNNALGSGLTRFCRLIALDLSGFSSSFVAEALSRQTTTGAAGTLQVSRITDSFSEGQYLFLAANYTDGSSTSYDEITDYSHDEVVRRRATHRPERAYASPASNLQHAARYEVFSNTTQGTTIRPEIRGGSSNSSGTAGFTHAGVAALQLTSVTKFIPQIIFLD